MGTVTWGDRSRSELHALFQGGALAAFAAGALEQHGEHLPTDVDTFFASRVLDAAADRSECTVVILPVLPYGFSEYHKRFGGTVSLSAATFLSVVSEICASVRDAGASALVIVNGHGGNGGLLRAVSQECSDARFVVVAASYWDFAPASAREGFAEDGGRVGHAGQFETSLALALRGRQIGDVNDRWRPAREPTVAATWDLLGDSGVVGNPNAATQELGEAFFEAAVDGLTQVLHQLARQRAPVG